MRMRRRSEHGVRFRRNRNNYSVAAKRPTATAFPEIARNWARIGMSELCLAVNHAK
jgi:hypothetical protein